ncbi:TPA: hypothetical protein ACX6QF_003657 [Photobacterium damselae]
MALYSISYDLNNPGQKYENIYSVIRSFGGYNHIMESTWLVSTSLSASQVFDKFTSYLDNNDKMFISKVNVNEYQGWLDEDTWKWIREHV